MASKPMTTLGTRLAWARSVVGISIKDLQRLAELKSPTVYLIESDGRVPRAEALIRLAQVFGTTVEWLVNGDGEAPTLESVAVAHAKAIEAYHVREAATPKRQSLKPTGT